MNEKTKKRTTSVRPTLRKSRMDYHPDALTEDAKGPLDLYWS